MLSFQHGVTLPTATIPRKGSIFSLFRFALRRLTSAQTRKAWPCLACHLSSFGVVLAQLQDLPWVTPAAAQSTDAKGSSCASVNKQVQPSPTEYVNSQFGISTPDTKALKPPVQAK